VQFFFLLIIGILSRGNRFVELASVLSLGSMGDQTALSIHIIKTCDALGSGFPNRSLEECTLPSSRGQDI